MRPALLALAALLLWCAPTWADSLLDVNIAGTFVATQPCSSNCTERFSISFEFDPEEYPVGTSTYGYAVPESLSIWASGFLGSFNSISYQGSDGFINLSEAYMPFLDSGGDEFDIRFPLLSPSFFPIGDNTIYFEFFGTKRSPAFINAFGPGDCCVQPAFYKSTVEPVVAVPESGSKGMLLMSGAIIGVAFLNCKRMRFPCRQSSIQI